MSKKNTNPLIARYGTEVRFVNWKLETRNGKTTKLPYQINGRLASSTDSDTWTEYQLANAKSPGFVGIVFTPARDLLGVDLDKCLTLKKGKPTLTDERLLTLITEADTYTEISPSGTGLHLYLALSSPLTLTANRHQHYEAYTEGRYFTVTQNSFGAVKDVRTVTPEEAIRLLTILGYPWKKITTSFDDLAHDPPPTSETVSLIDPLPDAKVLEGMFAASNGAEIRALHDINEPREELDLSRTDATFLSHLAFWCQKDPVQMERIWLASPLGGRKKTRDREDYRKRTITNAIAHCTSTYTPAFRGESAVPIDDDTLGLLFVMKGKQKSFYKNTENIVRVLLRHEEFKDTIRFDAYHYIIERKYKGTWRMIEDRDYIDIQTRISVLFSDFAHVGKEMVADAIVQASYHNMIDSGADYLRALVWDKTARLDEWLHHTYNTANNEYHHTVGANWLKGMVKRVILPGCKFDYVLVLEGPQGIRKSTSLLTLAGSLGHIETTTSTENKDFFMQLIGNAIVEFSEGETLSRTEVKRMKAIITVQVDKFRAPYGRTVMPHPRRSVFAMTTNQTEYLKDETGNRRWLPVAVNGSVNLKWLEENREQLFAEAYYRVITKSETTWEFPEKEMEEQQAMRRVQDANAEPVTNWYIQLPQSKRDAGITVDQAFRDALHNGFTAPITHSIKIGIADVLTTILFLEKKRGMVGGIQSNRWYPTTKTPEPITESTPFDTPVTDEKF